MTEEQKLKKKQYDAAWRLANRERLNVRRRSQYVIGSQSGAQKEKKKKYDKVYREVNREAILSRNRERYAANPQKYLVACKKWYRENVEKAGAANAAYRAANWEKVLSTSRSWKRRNPEKMRAYREKSREKDNLRRQRRLRADPVFKIATAVRGRIGNAIRKALKGRRKADRTVRLLGCSFAVLKTHIESQFQIGMSWENHGIHGWHIDHVRPCASFDLSDPAQQRQCFHYTNLQPLWAIDNLEKADKYE